ncbi:ABC transporter ATP-binding protein [Acidianus manzaensis]|uniref:Peptide ABC transporter ATP-binding protein n=1 Tax=Acidianus manzaensis TaxID=282676 RepID=A0A1W6JZ02_9CREN|nr:ABC transporter ATP-binding protein [Acidianus manzaensis]ARM75477.1 peptide ABC transporter ATP-binding protein [Acidianus manzaensis]
MSLNVRNLEVTYVLNKFTNVYAINNISFDLEPGDVIGIIGETGSGKTTIANAIMRALPESAIVNGSILLDNLDLLKMNYKEFRKKIAWEKISIIPQYSMNSLNPIKRVGVQLVRILQEHEDISNEDAINKILDLFKQVNLSEDILFKYPDELSGGQKQRVVIVSALLLNPELVIADEPTTALDVINQARVINLLKEKVINQNRIVIYITHDIAVVAGLANKIMTLYGGKIMEIGDIKEIFKEPLNPYTKGLLASVPDIENGKPKAISYIPGDPINQTIKPKGCPFYSRCSLAMDVCKESFPEGVKIGNRIVYCHAVSKK